MIHWSWRQWLAEPWRALLSAIVFGAALALSVLFEGIQTGIDADVRAFSSSLAADLVAMEAGSRYFGILPSELPQLSRAQLEEVPGVRSVHPVAVLPMVFEGPLLHSPIALVAYEERGGPPWLASGALPVSEGQIVLDARLARRQSLGVGDRVSLLGVPLTVSGLSGDTASPFMPLAFVSYDTLLSIVLTAKLPVGLDDYSLLSSLLIDTDPGVPPAELRAALKGALPETDFYTPAELAEFNSGFSQRLLGPVLKLLSAIAMVITALTMGLLRYADVQGQLGQYGTQKALGATPWQLALALASGSALVAFAAAPIAIALAQLMAEVVAAWNPLYQAHIWNGAVLARGLVLGSGAALLGGLWPLRRLRGLDPALVFQR